MCNTFASGEMHYAAELRLYCKRDLDVMKLRDTKPGSALGMLLLWREVGKCRGWGVRYHAQSV